MTLVFWVLFAPGRAFAVDHPQPVRDSGVRVDGALINVILTPGQTYQHELTISYGGAGMIAVQIEARGFGQSLSGGYLPLPAFEDSNPFSGRSFISAISQNDFRLAQGESQKVTVTLTLPANTAPGAYYATIFIAAQNVGDSATGMGARLTFTVPVVISTGEGFYPQRLAHIQAVLVNAIQSGQPLQATLYIKNTGDYHFTILGELNIFSSDGTLLATSALAGLDTPLLPGYTGEFHLQYQPDFILPAGTYTLEAQALLEDAAVLDQRRITFYIDDGKFYSGAQIETPSAPAAFTAGADTADSSTAQQQALSATPGALRAFYTPAPTLAGGGLAAVTTLVPFLSQTASDSPVRPSGQGTDASVSEPSLPNWLVPGLVVLILAELIFIPFALKF